MPEMSVYNTNEATKSFDVIYVTILNVIIIFFQKKVNLYKTKGFWNYIDKESVISKLLILVK